MKAATQDKLKQIAHDGQCRLVYFDAAGFSASLPVQLLEHHEGCHIGSHLTHCKRSVLGAPDCAANTLLHFATADQVQRTTVIEFLDSVAEQNNGQPTFEVLDNARIHHHHY